MTAVTATPPKIRRVYRDPANAENMLQVYDRAAGQILPRLDNRDRELVLLQIIARAQQSLDSLGTDPKSR